MSKPIILARSPFLVEVDEVSSDGSKIEVFIWNGIGSAPVSPNYVLSKFVASPTNFQMKYDISNYIREYIKKPDTQDAVAMFYTYNYCNVKVKRYNLVTGTYTLLDETEYYAVDGYHKSGHGYSFSDIPELNGTSIYLGLNLYKSYINNFCDFNIFPVINGDGWYIVYGEQGSEVTHTYTIEGDEPQIVNLSYTYDYFQLYNPSEELVETYNFEANEYCQDTTTLYYVNSKGFLQTTCLNGTVKLNIETNGSEYQLYEQNYVNGFTIDAEKQAFNKNGVHKFTINTNWKPERWNVILQEIMLSECLFINPSITLQQEFYNMEIVPEMNFIPFPVKLNTNQTQLFRHINDKLINYQLEFEYLKALVYTNM